MTISSRYTHFIVTFDSRTELIEISFVESDDAATNSSDSQIFKVIDFKLSDLMASGTGKAKEVLGSAILLALAKSRNIENKIPIENEPELQEAMDHMNKLMMEKANSGEPDAQYFIASKYVDDALESLDSSLLEESEKWYKEAEKNGSKKAAEFLKEIWPSLKEDYQLRIERKKQNGTDS